MVPGTTYSDKWGNRVAAESVGVSREAVGGPREARDEVGIRPGGAGTRHTRQSAQVECG